MPKTAPGRPSTTYTSSPRSTRNTTQGHTGRPGTNSGTVELPVRVGGSLFQQVARGSLYIAVQSIFEFRICRCPCDTRRERSSTSLWRTLQPWAALSVFAAHLCTSFWGLRGGCVRCELGQHVLLAVSRICATCSCTKRAEIQLPGTAVRLVHMVCNVLLFVDRVCRQSKRAVPGPRG